MTMAISYTGKTDTGKLRQNNEDAFYPDPKDGTHDPSGAAAGGHLFIVADGVGGNRGGARAAQIAVTRLPAFYYGATNGDPTRGLRLAFDSVAHEIVAEAAANPDRSNMSCTVVAAVVKDNVATIAHLGDARAYLLRGGALQPLTTDHTWVQMQVEKGTLSAAEAENHPERNVITKSMGNPAFPEPTLRPVVLQDGDRLLLCSDGLCGLATDAEMAAVLNRASNPAAAVGPLIDLANRKGGTDNITAVVIQAGRAAAPPRKSNVGLLVGMMTLVALFAVAFFLLQARDGGAAGGTPVAETIATAAPGETVAVVVDGATAAPGQPTSTLAAGATVTATTTLTPTVPAMATRIVGATTLTPVAASVIPTSVAANLVAPELLNPPITDCPPAEDSPNYTNRNQPIEFRWRLAESPASGSYFWVGAGQLGNVIDLQRVELNQAVSPNEWMVQISISDFYVNGETDYQWRVVLVGPDVRKTTSQLSCFFVVGGGGGGETEAPATPVTPTDPDSDGDSKPDSQDECDNEPEGDNPDPDRPGCPAPEPGP